MKRCTVCGDTKLLKEFHRNTSCSDNRHTQCRSCISKKKEDKKRAVAKSCAECDNIISPHRTLCKSCASSGDRSTFWNGGRSVDSRGYVYLSGYRDHPNSNKIGAIFEHRLVMSQVLGRPLLPQEEVHHRNGIRDDNRPENLELWSKSQPSGQRVEDKVEWAIQMLELYRPESLNPELLQ